MKRKILLGALAFVVLAGIAYFGFFSKKDTLPLLKGRKLAARKVVQVVSPKVLESAGISSSQLCVLEPLERAELNSRLPGIVKKVTKNIGDKFRMNETLLELDVPDVKADVELKKQIVKQKEVEYKTSQANLEKSKAGILTANSRIKQAESALIQANAMSDFRSKRLERFQILAKDESISGGLLDEQNREYQAALAGVEVARAGIEQAKGSLKEKELEIIASQAEVEQKKSAIDVAAKELEKAMAHLGLANIKAPFDGILVRRTADAGDFVSPPSGVAKDPILVVVSDQHLRVTARFPDTIVSGLSAKTPVEINFSQAPDLVIKGNVTRFSPLINAVDRSVSVEVDLEMDMGRARVIENSILLKPEQMKQLLLGITGTMKIQLQNLRKAGVVPSSAVVRKGGKPVVYVVVDRKVHLLQAKIEMDDGKEAVILVADEKTESHWRYLNQGDKVVLTRQSELEENLEVDAKEVKP
jgi:multidrug resistance efflux pump